MDGQVGRLGGRKEGAFDQRKDELELTKGWG